MPARSIPLHRRRRRGGRRIGGLLVAVALTSCQSGFDAAAVVDRVLRDVSETTSGVAEAAPPDRLIEVHWGHPNPAEVDRFRILWGLQRDQYEIAIEVAPRPEPDGTYVSRVRVPADRTVHLVLTAFGPGGESVWSNRGICEPGCARARPLSDGARR